MPTTIAPQSEQIPVGQSIPALLPHAVSVSLPTWRDNVAYEEGEPWLVEKMTTGYPRFFVHKSIQQLAAICLQKFGLPSELCLLLPTPLIAQQCRFFMQSQSMPDPVPVRIVEFVICPTAISTTFDPSASPADEPSETIQIVLFPKDAWKFAKAFWQHTGSGISSRRAERGLRLLGEPVAGGATEDKSKPQVETRLNVGRAYDPEASTKSIQQQPNISSRGSYSRNRHYSRTAPAASASASTSLPLPVPLKPTEELEPDHAVYVEQRYGRNLPLKAAAIAKTALKRRIAGVLEADIGAEARVSEDDVWLYPTGMSAIWHAHLASLGTREGDEKKSISFGFPYIDTLKLLQKFGPGAHFFGFGTSEDLVALEELLRTEQSEANPRPLQALFCEFPSNPLLRSPDLVKLRELANEYGFYLIVDETIGNFVNVEVLEWADIVVSSLTKVFSGDVNVMGGSLVLNPKSAHYSALRSVLVAQFEDTYFSEDAIFMERNSRDFRPRIETINANTAFLCELLHAQTTNPASPVKRVYYPRYESPENYVRCMRSSPPAPENAPRYGGLFSITFHSAPAARAFFDVLRCAKGPSLGTNFTLASPYTLLAHYTELDWAAKYGVESALVRVSVGLEDKEVLERWFREALEAAEKELSE